MHHALMLAARTVAFGIASLAFYFAFFLYEDEQGSWQNRIENLWASVYDRAKITDTTSTALFSKVAEAVRNWFNGVFGNRLLSVQAVVVSANVSLGGALLAITFVSISNPRAELLYTFGAVMNRATSLITGVIFLGFAALPAYFKKPWGVFASSVPVIFLVGHEAHDLIVYKAFTRLLFGSEMLTLVLSVLSDCLAILIMRRIFTSISQAVSTLRLVYMIAQLLLLTAAICIYPFALRGAVSALRQPEDVYVATSLWFMNVTTMLFLLLPAAMLLLVMLHKLIWPLLSRLLYPLASRQVITNRNFMVPIGSLCLLFAVTPEHVGVRDIFKLFS
jgi:hypothetical protein